RSDDEELDATPYQFVNDDGGEGGGGVGKAHVKSSPAAWTLASIASTTGWGGRCASNAAGSGSGRVTPTSPPRGSNGVPTTSAAATPAAIPTEASSAYDTTTGTATRSATSSARLTPPRGCTFTTTTSAASSSIIWRGSGSWRTSSSAAIGTSTSLRNVRIPSRVATGCSTYSRSNGAIVSIRRRAVSTSQTALASTRNLPSGPSAWRTARRRSRSRSGS